MTNANNIILSPIQLAIAKDVATTVIDNLRPYIAELLTHKQKEEPENLPLKKVTRNHIRRPEIRHKLISMQCGENISFTECAPDYAKAIQNTASILGRGGHKKYKTRASLDRKTIYVRRDK